MKNKIMMKFMQKSNSLRFIQTHVHLAKQKLAEDLPFRLASTKII
jgi:hypothetical protein